MKSYRGRIDDPGFMEGILEDIRNTPREYWLDRLARYDNEKPGDIVLPGVPPRRIADLMPATPTASKKSRRKLRHAA